MFTLYRAAYTNNPRAATFCGTDNDEKPEDQKNGASFIEINTGKVYRYDEENNRWYEGELT